MKIAIFLSSQFPLEAAILIICPERQQNLATSLFVPSYFRPVFTVLNRRPWRHPSVNRKSVITSTRLKAYTFLPYINRISCTSHPNDLITHPMTVEVPVPSIYIIPFKLTYPSLTLKQKTMEQDQCQQLTAYGHVIDGCSTEKFGYRGHYND